MNRVFTAAQTSFARGFVLAAALVSGACGGAEAPSAVPPAPISPDPFFPAEGAQLHYALDLPAGAGPFPAVVVGHGSGPATKDEGAFVVGFWRSIGYAVLRYDKRGAGRSTGTYRGLSAANSPAQVEELADDMIAGITFLKTRPDILAGRIGLMGVSQAGWIMAAAAERSSDVRFFVAPVGSVVPVGVNIFYEELRGGPLEDAYAQLALFSGPEGWDPVPALRATSASGLWLLAAEDRLVPTRRCVPIIEGLRAEGARFSVRTYPGVGHELGGSSLYWNDVSTWLSSQGLR